MLVKKKIKMMIQVCSIQRYYNLYLNYHGYLICLIFFVGITTDAMAMVTSRILSQGGDFDVDAYYRKV